MREFGKAVRAFALVDADANTDANADAIDGWDRRSDTHRGLYCHLHRLLVPVISVPNP